MLHLQWPNHPALASVIVMPNVHDPNVDVIQLYLLYKRTMQYMLQVMN